MRNITIVSYDPLWPQKFRVEAALVAAIFGEELIALHHIGSTAIPRLSAKPVVDMMPIVKDIEKIDALNAAMMKLGYQPKGENGIPGRRFFVKGGEATRTHHIHAYEPDNPEVARHLDLRDYLTAHPEEAAQYAALKAELARNYRNDVNAYSEGKTAFIQAILRKAQTWRNTGTFSTRSS